ncbi:hypothetical protein HPP92_011287 [Vanilla planifolia]|uniref:Uncharacterized protein n=1 Tax=Vanilla planifolia TaxID=51239 RepID=A0A835UYB0_VANPL|nr:hypothetical protein HPP92_011287 [Vanilla planifolia]
MEDGSNTTANVAGAIAVSLDLASTPEARSAAVAYLESVKGGDIHLLANTSLRLIRNDCSLEIRLYGLKMLQHVVRFRWDEFSIEVQNDFAKVAISLLLDIVNQPEEWVLKSQTAALVAEVVRKQGVTFWQELLPSLVSLSNKGPVEAELVAMILRWLPEDITVHNEDLEGDRRRVLLRGLAESLTEILPLLYSLLEKHFGAALNEYNRQQIEVTKKHTAAVTAALNAVNAYAEWAPLPDIARYRLIHGCGFLLSSPEFRFHACEFFKLVSQRKRPHDANALEFDSAMVNIFQVLIHASGEFLNKYGISAVIVDESDFKFAERTCENMVLLGSLHIQCIAGDRSMTSQFLELMLRFFQHYKFALHFQSLFFWLALMRDQMPRGKATLSTSGTDHAADSLGLGSVQANEENKGLINLASDDTFSVIIEVSLHRLMKKSKVTGYIPKAVALELWTEEFDASDFSHYRSRLLELIRLVASRKPLVAAVSVSQRLDIVLNSSQISLTAENLALIECMQPALEAIVSAIFDGSIVLNHHDSRNMPRLHEILEGLLQLLLSLKWTKPTLAELLAHYLDALGPYLKFFSDSTVLVVNKLFDLLKSIPLTPKDPSNIARHARLQVCSSFIRIAKAADKKPSPTDEVIICSSIKWPNSQSCYGDMDPVKQLAQLPLERNAE